MIVKSENEAASEEEKREERSITFPERVRKAIYFLFDFAPGTLWVVKDDIWNAFIEGFVKQRKAHPGLCIGRAVRFSCQDTVPMLIGTSRKHGPSLAVRNVFEGTSRITHFNVTIKPVPIPITYAAGVGDSRGFKPNHHKPVLNPFEKEQMKAVLKARGIW